MKEPDQTAEQLGNPVSEDDVCPDGQQRRPCRDRDARLYDLAPVGYVTINSDGLIERANAAAARLLGLGEDELVQQALGGFVSPEDRDLYDGHHQQLFSSGTPLQYELRLVRRDGSQCWTRLDATIDRDEENGSARGLVVLIDVSRQKRELDTLSVGELRYRTIVESAQEGIWMIDAAGRTTFTNAKMAEMLGYSGREMVGRFLFDFMTDTCRRIAETHLIRRAKGISEQHDFKFRRRDGTTLWTLVSTNPIYDTDGSYTGALAMITDITERKRSEGLNGKLAAIIEASSDLIATATPDGRIAYMNQAGRRLLGIAATESLERTHIAHYHPASAYRKVHDEGIPAALSQGRWLGDNAMLRCDGSEVPVSQLIIAQRDQETGQLEFISTICRDISERLRAEGALRQLQQEQELILDNAPPMIWYKDTNNRILRVNAVAAKSLGLPKDAIEGRPTSEFYPDEAERYYQDDLIVIRSGQPRLGIEEPYQMPSGKRRWIQTDKVPLKDESGQVNRVLVMSMDITARKEADEALREADRRKDEFLAILAHELRNPLAPIKSAVEILRLPGVDDATLVWCRQVIDRQVEHLTRLVDDLLDISRITCGKIELERESLALADILQRALETSKPLLEARGHQLSLQLPSEPLCVEADALRLAQVLSNLLNNAAKYCEPGGRIGVSIQREDNDAVLRISDNGIGIPPAMLTHVFDMFFQVDRSLDKDNGGLGIGLNLAKQLVNLHGGTIAAYSEGEGKGSEFVVRLPVTVGPFEHSAACKTEEAGVRHRILVVDDNFDAAESLSMLLEMMGHEVRNARDGLEAIKRAEEFQPELILMDVGMPKLDGYGACRRIRAEPWGRRVVIAALTGLGQNEDRIRSQAAGFTHHLVKPVDFADLKRLVDSLPKEAFGPA